MAYALKFILLLLLLCPATLLINATKNKDDDNDYNRCEGIVKTWSTSSLAVEVKEDRHLLQDLLFFLHIPRTGGRTYFHCFLRKLYASSLECPRSYDKLRFDPSKPNCRLLTTHDDYSVISKLHRESTSVVTILRNPVDRVFSTYEFSVEVAARFLVHPNLTSVARMSKRVRSKAGAVSTLDIWPWKYLVPWMREDLFARRDARKRSSQTDTRSDDSYDMEELVMPLHDYINDPIAQDIIHNGATFQIAGLTNNSYLAEAHDIRRCVLKHHVLGEHVLAVAKKRLDNMLYVGLTEDHKESATMFANVVGAQVISQLTASNNTRASTVKNRSGGFPLSDSRTSSSDFVSSESYHQNRSTRNVSKISSAEPAEAMNGNMTVGKLIKAYETCISNLRDTQSQRRTASLKRISPVNFTKEARRQIPEVLLHEIQSLNSLDMKLYKYARDIFSKQHKQMTQKLVKSENLESASTHSDVVSESQKKYGDIYNNLLTDPAWNNLWIAIFIVFSVLVIALFVNARRRTSKLKI